jgi:hypothetical protein
MAWTKLLPLQSAGWVSLEFKGMKFEWDGDVSNTKPVTSLVYNLVRLLNASEHQFPHLWNGEINSTYLQCFKYIKRGNACKWLTKNKYSINAIYNMILLLKNIAQSGQRNSSKQSIYEINAFGNMSHQWMDKKSLTFRHSKVKQSNNWNSNPMTIPRVSSKIPTSW